MAQVVAQLHRKYESPYPSSSTAPKKKKKGKKKKLARFHKRDCIKLKKTSAQQRKQLLEQRDRYGIETIFASCSSTRGSIPRIYKELKYQAPQYQSNKLYGQMNRAYNFQMK
jgi:hypothetical protein